jgi:hypothetical protein
VTVAIPNIPADEGVIHLIPKVLLPPRKHREADSAVDGNFQPDRRLDSDFSDFKSELTVEELIERLEPYAE